jgi:single-strand DNA-binding protein
MSSYNRVTLVGNLTRQPELRKTKNGAAVTDLGIALNRVWTGENGQRQEETTFVDVTVWGRAAENAAQYLQKGRSVLVEGRLQMESWQDKQSGQERSKLRVVADTVQFLGNSHEAGPSDDDDDRESRRSEGRREDRREERRESSRSEDRRSDSKRDRRYATA